MHYNTSITDTHCITYLKNAVTGRAKDVIQSNSCDPAYNSTVLNELMSCFGDPTSGERLHKSIGKTRNGKLTTITSKFF